MEKINLQQVIPDVFAEREQVDSEIWLSGIEFQKGRSYLIEAASGMGKSSLCSYIYGYRKDYRGTICFDAEDIKKLTAEQWSELRRASLSMLFQDLRLFSELTAFENIELKNHLTGFRDRTWMKNGFETLGITDKMDTPASKLSFGQQQRVALLRALCQPFDFIFLDEPVSHLDDENNRAATILLMQEATRLGAGIIVTSIGKHPDIQYDNILRL